MRRFALAYALLVLVCVFAIVWRWSHGARGVAAEPDARSTATAPARLEALPASESRSSPSESVAPAPAGEVLAKDLRGFRVDPANPSMYWRPEMRLRALDGFQGKPLPGARFTWASEDALREITGPPPKLGMLPRARVEEVLAAIGASAVADSAGEVEIEAGLGVIHVHARSGDSAAHGMFGPGSELQDMYLYPDRSLEICAVDPTGQPLAGAVVQIGIQGPWPHTLWRGETEADGHVIIEGADELLAPWHARRRSQQLAREDTPLESFQLAADVGFRTFPSAAVFFTLDPWPARPIELRVPRAGRLAVRLVDELGVLIAEEPARVRVRVAGGELEPESRSTLIGESDLEEGRAAFEPVQLGLDLELELLTRGRRNVVRFVHGPDESMPDLELTVVPGAKNPEVSGRLLDPDGAPLADAAFELEANARSSQNDVPRSSGSMILRTDSEGRFRQRLLIELPDAPICVVAFSHPARGLHPRRRVMRELAAELEQPEIDLGDVRLVAPEGL